MVDNCGSHESASPKVAAGRYGAIESLCQGIVARVIVLSRSLQGGSLGDWPMGVGVHCGFLLFRRVGVAGAATAFCAWFSRRGCVCLGNRRARAWCVPFGSAGCCSSGWALCPATFVCVSLIGGFRVYGTPEIPFTAMGPPRGGGGPFLFYAFFEGGSVFGLYLVVLTVAVPKCARGR